MGHKAAALGLVSPEADVLLARLEERMQTAASIPPSDGLSLERMLARMVRDDFGNDRVIEVDGWVLSATEVELCAFAAASGPISFQNGRLRPKALM